MWITMCIRKGIKIVNGRNPQKGCVQAVDSKNRWKIAEKRNENERNAWRD